MCLSEQPARRSRPAKDGSAVGRRGVILYLFVGADAPTLLVYAPTMPEMHLQYFSRQRAPLLGKIARRTPLNNYLRSHYISVPSN